MIQRRHLGLYYIIDKKVSVRVLTTPDPPCNDLCPSTISSPIYAFR
jgi:hypothetical protein